MAVIPGYQIGVAYSGGASVGIGVAVPGIFALPEGLQGPVQAIEARLNAFRNAATFYVSKSATADNNNNGTSPGEPLASLSVAVTKANAYVTANPGALCTIHLAPGVYVENNLPLRVKRNICIKGDGILRTTMIKPALGQEMNGFLKVDSGFMAWGLTFAGHQANSLTGQQSWAISFDESADNTGIGASSLGAYIQISPYIQNCTSMTAEDDSGIAPSTSTGDTGGGILVDGNACALNSPIRSMVVDSYTQVNLGGPGCLVKNDGYAQLVSFFGTFCTYHVRTETGGQVNLSGGTTDFGIYGLMADGFSPKAIFTGTAREAAYGANIRTVFAALDHLTDTFTANAHGLLVNDQIVPEGGPDELPPQLLNGQTYFVIDDGYGTNTFKLSTTEGGDPIDFSTAGVGNIKFMRSGSLSVDVVNFSANRLGPISRPNPGQLLFPRVNFPSAGTPGSSGNTVLVESIASNAFSVTLGTTTFDHFYAGGGTVTVTRSGAALGTYSITSCTYDFQTGVTTLTATGYTPRANDNIRLSDLAFICPTEGVYVITGSVPIDANGTPVADDSGSKAGYRINFYSTVNRGLRHPIAQGQVIDFRLRSQISAPGHTFEYVGSGTNYNALPWRGGVPVRANERVESNNGRVYSSNTNELGDFRVGDAFAVDGTTGTVTINTDQFNLAGLNFIGPFSRNGGLSTVGVQLQEVSNNTSLIASTGTADGNTAPTQFAVKTYVDTTTETTIAQAKNYTDQAAAGTLSAATEYTDQKTEDALNEAKAYTDTGVAETLQASRDYTDQELEVAVDGIYERLLDNNYPDVLPTLDLPFALSRKLDGRLSFSRSSTATYFDAKRILRTAAVNAPRFAHDSGTGESLGVLVEASATNALTYNLHLTHSSWEKVNLNAFPHLGTAPDGSHTATKLVETTSAIGKFVQKEVTGLTPSVHYTISVYAKAQERAVIVLMDGITNTSAAFNLNTEQTSTYLGFPVSYGIEDVANGWKRCFLTFTSGSTSVQPRLYIGSSYPYDNYSGNGRSGLLIWAPQLERGSFHTSTIPTPAAFTSRVSSATFYDATGQLLIAPPGIARSNAYLPDNDGRMAPAGLLLEAAATNITPRSEVFSDTGGASGSWSSNFAPAPDANSTADKWIPATGIGDANSSRRQITAVSGTYTASIYVRKTELSYVMLSWSQSTGASYGVLFNLDTGAFVKDNRVNNPTGTNYSIQKFPNGWYRLSVTQTLSEAGTDTYFNFGATDSADATWPFPTQISYVADGTSGILFWGAQIEAGLYPTSYIPTDETVGGITRAAEASSSVAVTRAADSLTLTGAGFSDAFNATTGSLVAEFRSRGVGNRPILSVDDGTAVNQLLIKTDTLDAKFNVTADSDPQVTITSGAVAANALSKVAAAYALADFSAAEGGSPAVGDASGVVPIVDRLRIGTDPAGNAMNSTISRITIYPTRLGNPQLTTVTA